MRHLIAISLVPVFTLLSMRVSAEEPTAPVAATQASDTVPTQVLERGPLRLTLAMPDSERGHYRGARFDWSGMMIELKRGGQTYWDEWNPADKPTHHDANAVGPAMEFDMEAPPGYSDAAVGATYMKIGVGTLRRTNDRPYRFYGDDPIVDPGRRTARVEGDSVTFTHDLTCGGFAYAYTKRVALVDQDTLRIECTLRNTGSRVLETEVYTHNFLRVAGSGWAPGVRLVFDQPVRLRDGAKVSDTLNPREIGFDIVRPLSGDASAWAPLAYDAGRAPRQFQVIAGGQTLSVEYDFEPSRVVLFGLQRTVCVEPFKRIKLEPNASESWVQTYRMTD